jgi:hypothetical protein
MASLLAKEGRLDWSAQQVLFPLRPVERITTTVEEYQIIYMTGEQGI